MIETPAPREIDTENNISLTMSDLTKLSESGDPKTAGEKRSSSDDAGSESKKLCIDDTETEDIGGEEKNGTSSSSPCEVSSTSYQSSNGSSTSTKTIATQEMGVLPVIESVFTEATDEPEKTPSENNDSVENSDEIKTKPVNRSMHKKRMISMRLHQNFLLV